MMYFVGIDTSCYTTSVALADAFGDIICDGRKRLEVPDGTLGLRQSDMVFAHVKNLPNVLPRDCTGVLAVAASERPRPADDSYMPVFAVSSSYAKTISLLTGAQYYPLTHQHAHVGAALLGNDIDGEILGVHLSGGTSDLLKLTISEGIIKRIEPLGSASDITAGQLIDRIGVEMGLSFPAGAQIENLASGVQISVELSKKFKPSVNGMAMSFSGAEAAAKRLLKAGEKRENVAVAILDCIADSLEIAISFALAQTNINRTLLFGGVMKNEIIKEKLIKTGVCELFFAKPEYSEDNACGLAVQAAKIFNKHFGRN